MLQQRLGILNQSDVQFCQLNQNTMKNQMNIQALHIDLVDKIMYHYHSK